MEKGKDTCRHSPTLKDEKIKKILGEKVCGGIYNEDVIKEKVKRMDVYETQVIISFYEKDEYCTCGLMN